MLVFDADAHVEEGPKTWEFLDAENYPRRPITVTFEKDTIWGEHNAVWLIDYKVRQFAANPTTMTRAVKKPQSVASQELSDVGARIDDLDKYGIGKQVIYPSLWLGCLAEDVDLEIALAKSYNEFMATQCNQSGGRLFYSAVIPFRRPDAAVEEIRRVRQMGSAVSIFVRGMEWDMPVSHPMFWPIYEEAERQQLVMALHIGFGSPSIVRMFEGMPRSARQGHIPIARSLGSGLLSGQLSQYALGCVLNSEILEHFPHLRWVVLETGSEWIPPVVRAQSRRRGKDMASYFKSGQICVSAEPEERIPDVVDCLGDECLVVASDMPHGDDFHHDRPEEAWLERGDLSQKTLEKILKENTARLYGI